MNKIWHPYTEWEDWKNGMWRTVTGRDRLRYLKKAIEFTGDSTLYGSYMHRVIVEWPTSCEHHLTDVNQNRKAWIGHAATCLAIKCPEDITRSAWGHLTKRQQDQANAEAQAAIEAWEQFHEVKNLSVHQQVGISGVSYGHPGCSGLKIRATKQSAKLSTHLQGHIEKRHCSNVARLQ